MKKSTVTYLGTNTLVFEKGETTLVIDPHFSRPGLLALLSGLRPDSARIVYGLRLVDIDQLDAVLLTHTHYDDALDLPAVIRLAGGEVFGSESAGNIIRGAGLLDEIFHRVNFGKAYRIGGFTVHFHPSRHIDFSPPLGWLMPDPGKISENLKTPAPFWAYRCGEVYAIQVDDTLVFGSAGFEPGAYAHLDVRTVVLGIGGLESKPVSYLRRLYRETVLSTGVERVWFSHWDNFFRPLDRGLKHLGFSNWTVRRLKDLGAEHGQIVAELPFNQPLYL